MEEAFEEDESIQNIESDEHVEELLENDEISSEEAGFLHGWNNIEEEQQ